MTAAPTLNQIKAQVAAIRRKYSGARAIGIRCEGRWTEPALQQENGEKLLIRQCDSPLAIRMALREGDADTIRVLITNLSDNDLSNDILVRLKPRKLVLLDSWQIVKTLFQARAIDPRLTQHRWMADALMEMIAHERVAPVASGFLDAETVWPILLSRKLGLDAEQPDLFAVLKWSIDGEHVARFCGLEPEFRDAAIAWLAGHAGSSVEAILTSVAAEASTDALPIGLSLAVFLHPQHASLLQRAMGKMEERFLASQELEPEMMSRWNAAATEVVRSQITDGRCRQQLLDRADEILREVDAETHAWLSDTSPLGFDQRLIRFANQVNVAVESDFETSTEPLLEARSQIIGHERSQRERRQLERVDMAVRLVQWLRLPEPSTVPQSLADAARAYHSVGGFADWARLSLRSGDRVGELSQAYAKLFERCTAVQEQRAHRFAELLCNYTSTDSSDEALVHVEQFLDAVVAPIAADHRVLLIVMDGMSVAVFRELMADLLDQEWMLLATEQQGLPIGLATVPSVTEVSRTSLLCGTLRPGDQNIEQREFAAHAGLNAQSRSGYPPVLFHKASLQEADDGNLAADVRKEIGSSHRKIVGVVINAVDDHLTKGQQIDVHWSKDTIKVLPALLHEAKSSNRVVIMLSDHGHVLDCGAGQRQHEGGERWREDDGAPTEGELRIAGDRVVIPASKSLIGAWTERLRYGVKKNGYHGGLAPQEMVIPVAVLAASEPFPAGWSEALVDTPTWWEIQDEERPVVGEPALKPVPPAEPLPGMLFPLPRPEESVPGGAVEATVDAAAADEGESRTPHWVTALLACPVFESQKRLAGRAAPPDEMFAEILTAVDARGGRITSVALARAMNCSTLRLRGMLAIAQRVLNIDGYEVITRDDASDTVELNRHLLTQQFDLI